jgi:hypothetical protein
MKKFFLLVAFIATTFVQHSFAQDDLKQSQLLTLYYNIKDALVAGNANTASSNADAFVKTLKDIDEKIVPAASRDALLKDAAKISSTKDLKLQREQFAVFSANMIALAKAVRLTTQPVHEAYCPMKKAYWLSSEKAIKNPYYGNAMLTCGKVTETLQ